MRRVGHDDSGGRAWARPFSFLAPCRPGWEPGPQADSRRPERPALHSVWCDVRWTNGSISSRRADVMWHAHRHGLDRGSRAVGAGDGDGVVAAGGGAGAFGAETDVMVVEHFKVG